MDSSRAMKWEDVFVVAGPTASGKSALAVALAEKWDAEIISADAYQVYRGLSVLTAQPNPDELSRVPHHFVAMLDVASDWSAADFARQAELTIHGIRARGKRIVLVGGAGFYLETLLDGMPETPPPDEKLRERLATLSVAEMVAELSRLDPLAIEVVDLKNPRRLQRAIEIVQTSGRPFASFQRTPDTSARGVVLNPPRDVLWQRIEQRTHSILANGAIEEVRAISQSSYSPICGKAIGLAEISALLAGKLTLDACREKIVIATRQYAKRQMTWFRNRNRWPLVTPESAYEQAINIFEKSDSSSIALRV